MYDGKKQKISVSWQKQTFVDSKSALQSEILNDIACILESLFKMRLIEKLIQPVDISERQKQAKQYGEKVKEMNVKLNKILNQVIEKAVSEENFKEKSLYEEITSKNNQLRQKIRTIERKYYELFYEGSFKYYRKIKAILGLSTEIQLINIQDWALVCLDKTNPQERSCC